MKLAADIVLVKGRVITWCEEEPEAEALALARGRILAVGKGPEAMAYAGPSTRVVDLNGRVVLPGFNDCHAHLASLGSDLSSLDLSDATSLEDLKAKVRERARSAAPGQWITGRNWDESKWPVRRYPDRRDLDQAAPDRPVALTRIDGHMLVANSQALRRLSLEGLEGVETDAEGNPTGVLREESCQAVWEVTRPGMMQAVGGLRSMIAAAHRLGITSIHDTVDHREIAAYLRLHRAGGLNLRVNLMPRDKELPSLVAGGISSGLGGEVLRLGPIKAFLDGSLGARTAALSEEYEDEDGNRGRLMLSKEELTSLVGEASEGGFQLALHAIGERAIDAALQSLAYGDSSTTRHRLEHFELPDEGHLKMARSLGIVASMQPNFVGQWSMPGGLYEQRLGKARLGRNNPFRLVLDEGIPLAFGSDHMPFSPMYGIHWAVNAPFDDQRLTVEEALRCYTQTPAYASFEENVKGTIEPGMLADLVVLEKDPFETPDRIKDIEVHMTIFDGKIVYKMS
ncbi:MAG: amidohydrolase [Thermoplasmata archaeon]